MENMFTELKATLLSGGAALVGFADVSILPNEARRGFDRAISFAVSLDPAIVAALTQGPIPAYAGEYERANHLLSDLGDLGAASLRQQGYRAEAQRPTIRADDQLSTPLPHKTAATRAGLGWVGKCALLITPQFGAAVRLGTILTDAPLPPNTPVTASRCGTCRACVDACPAGVMSGSEWFPGKPRQEFYDASACREMARRLSKAQAIGATLCGICIRACPHTGKWLNNFGVLSSGQ